LKNPGPQQKKICILPALQKMLKESVVRGRVFSACLTRPTAAEIKNKS